MSKRLVIAVLAVASAAPSTSCASNAQRPPEGQIVLHVQTDARLPHAPGVREPADAGVTGDRQPLFDRLSVEFIAPGASEPCATCVREFGADAELFSQKRASVGFVPPPGASGYRARVRLYRYGGLLGPRRASTIERVVALPSVAEEGVIDVTVSLPTEDLARPRGTIEAPEPVSAGMPDGKLQPGDFDAAFRRGCSNAPRAGEACVPGGTYWMGTLFYDVQQREHLVRMSPFFLDQTEVTVAALRASGVASDTDPTSSREDGGCTYGVTKSSSDALPVNCISRDLAAKFCAKAGKTLLSEARFEYVASALRGADYPWGNTAPKCPDAVYARAAGSKTAEYRACVDQGAGPSAPGAGRLDRLVLGDRTVVDLAGNVSEWMLDENSEEGEPCRELGLLTDPVCTTRSTRLPGTVVRGGSAASSVLSLLASARTVGPIGSDGGGGGGDARMHGLGFRCARDDDDAR